MAVILRPIFQGPGLAALREAQAERLAESARIRKLVGSAPYMGEIYGPASQDDIGPAGKLMETPDEVAGTWGNGDYKIYDDMGRNVLPYRTAWDSRIDVLTGLHMVVLPGEKGNPESEAAAEEIQSQWENFDERMTALKQAARMMELGFTVLENVWDIQTRGKSKGQFGIVEMIDRPVSWFGFDTKGRPKFKRTRYRQDPQAVGDYKCTWGRYGSLHSRYGRGGGQDCYPTVWTIDKYLKNHHEAVERAGYIPVVVTYPDDKSAWPQGRVNALIRNSKAQWKNVFVVPGEVTEVKVNELTTGAHASNAIGVSRMEVVTMLVSFLTMQVQGSQYASNTGPGAYAKDKVADTARMYKAPGDAAALEAMLNRGFVRPIMLANRPMMDESLWPRFAIDASFGEDLAFLLEAMERGVKMGAKIETVTFYDRFKIKGADLESNPDAELLTIREAPAFGVVPGAPQPEPAPEPPANSIARVERSFGEHGALIDIATHDGGHVFFDPGDPVYTENRGIVMRANLLQKGDVPVIPVSMIRRSA